MKTLKILSYLLLILIGLGLCDTARAKSLLKVAFLDIGQGDSIYIEAPNGAQMIIDGGPPGSLMGPLSSVMPFGDRSVNVVMVTNTDADHFAGFLDLVRDYDVGVVIEPGTHTSSSTHTEFQKLIAEKNIPEIMARKGMAIDIDKENGVKFTVLFPDRDVSSWTTNDGSIEGILTYGKTKIMFTGDGSKKTEEIILSENSPDILKSDILKVAHHGSATGSSEEFVGAIAPTLAVISAGLHNSYGLPKQVTLDTFARHNIRVVRTDQKGTIIFVSDGEKFTEK